MTKPVLEPTTDHPITVTPTGQRVSVSVGGVQIADSTAALTLRESTYPAVQYIPRADVDMSRLVRTEHETYCPYKGDCHYYTVRTDDAVLENAVWTYEAAYPAVAAITDHLAFYPDEVDVTVG